MTATKYDVEVYREGKWWMVNVPELDELTQARRLSDVDQAARELIAVTIDAPQSQVEPVVTSIKLESGHDIKPELDALKQVREERDRLEAEASLMVRLLAQVAAAAEVPVRDIGTMLGVSFQRAHQLASDDHAADDLYEYILRAVESDGLPLIRGPVAKSSPESVGSQVFVSSAMSPVVGNFARKMREVSRHTVDGRFAKLGSSHPVKK